jgi:hypothetical protein
MKKKTIKLSVKVVLLFAIPIFMSFLPELYPVFFGDWFCMGSGEHLEGVNSYRSCNHLGGFNGFHLKSWHWGYRHWAFVLMGLVIFIVQAFDLISDEN